MSDRVERRRRSGAPAWVWLGAAAALGAPSPAAAQLADRVADADGTVRFGYAVRPEVQICDQGVRVGEHHMSWRSHRDASEPRNCRSGWAEVVLEVRRGRVHEVELVTDERDVDPEAIDLGTYESREAVGLLFGLARGDASADAAEDAIFPAVLADVPDVWPELLGLARDGALPGDVRKSALFWLGQEAADAATEGLSEVALDEREDQDVREAAIFALSQRPDGEAVPALIEIARTGEQIGTRRTAMFWLAQSEDPRAVDFFEQVLLGRIR